MAYTARDFHKDLAIFSAGGILGPTRSRKLLAYAGRKGIQLAGLGVTRAAPALGAAALAHPVAAGAALGAATLATPPGQSLLAAAEEHGRQSRILYERARAELMATPEVLTRAFEAQPITVGQATGLGPGYRAETAKRVATKFNRAVKKGMAVVKKSTSNGKPGKLAKPRAALAMVSKVISAKKKKKKAPKSGIRRKIWTAIGRYR